MSNKVLTQVTNSIPVTNAVLTQTDIDYSIKIGKQTIKAKLTQEIAKINEEIRIYREKAENIFDLSQEQVIKIIKTAFKEQINNDKNLTKVRAAWNAFRDKHIRTNWGLVNICYLDNTANNIIRPYNGSDPKAYAKYVNDGLKISFSICVGFMPDNFKNDNSDERDYEEHEDDFDFTQRISVPAKLKIDMQRMLTVLQETSVLRNKQDALNLKLKNIDETMEEMEAKLLIQDLNRSERGKEVLELASEIISDVIEDSVQLAIK